MDRFDRLQKKLQAIFKELGEQSETTLGLNLWTVGRAIVQFSRRRARKMNAISGTFIEDGSLTSCLGAAPYRHGEHWRRSKFSNDGGAPIPVSLGVWERVGNSTRRVNRKISHVGNYLAAGVSAAKVFENRLDGLDS